MAKQPPRPVKPTYHVEFAPSAIKCLAKLPHGVQRKIAAKVDGLEQEPRPHGVDKIEGQEDLYRIRVGDYRVIYSIEDKEGREWGHPQSQVLANVWPLVCHVSAVSATSGADNRLRRVIGLTVGQGVVGPFWAPRLAKSRPFQRRALPTRGCIG